MRILLAEDDKDLNKALTWQLTARGYNVDSCGNGEEALYYGKQNIYDIILLDRMLPDREGTEVMTALRQLSVNTPIILITALGLLQDKITGLDLGADDYLVKPFDFEELLARIRCVTRRSLSLNAQPEGTLTYHDITWSPRKMCLAGPSGDCLLSIPYPASYSKKSPEKYAILPRTRQESEYRPVCRSASAELAVSSISIRILLQRTAQKPSEN